MLWLGLLVVAIASLLGVLGGLRNQHSIQQQRHMSVISSCRDTNERHRAVLAYLDKLAAKEVKEGKATKAQAKAGLKIWFVIEQKQFPVRDCQRLANKYVKQGG